MPLNRILEKIARRFDSGAYDRRRRAGATANDLRSKDPFPAGIISAFRKEKAQAAVGNGARKFSWALHEKDGRDKQFRDYAEDTPAQWISWYKYHHFLWRRPIDPVVADLARSVQALGRRTWRNFFLQYRVDELDWHDSYSVPDLYYVTRALGRRPSAVIDIGAGWGRLGMAWKSVGVPFVGVTDAIEQPYVLQHLYLSAIPDAAFRELVGSPRAPIKPSAGGIVHFPSWRLSDVADGSIDAVSAVQVLREISADALEFLFSEVARVLAPGGVFYVRDNDHEYREAAMHQVNVEERLKAAGLSLALAPELKQSVDIHGVPRVYRKES